MTQHCKHKQNMAMLAARRCSLLHQCL